MIAVGGARRAHGRAEIHDREQAVARAQATPDLPGARLRVGVGEARAVHPFAHAPQVHLDADPVVVVDLGRDRRRGVAAHAG